MNYTGERAVPWNPAVGVGVMTHHIMRYAWATPLCWQKHVVDLGCGTGYGSFMLSWVARHITALDIDQKSILYAGNHFSVQNMHYVVQDISRGIPAADVYVAFEVIEHLADPYRLVDSIKNTLIWSIPVNNAGQFHKALYSVDDIKHLMAGSNFYYQGDDGQIAPTDNAWFEPMYVLGVRP